MAMDKLQLSWIFIGLIFGLITILPIKRCLATQNGFISMLTASLMGIFHIWFSWVAVVIALFCFTYGLYQNRYKYLGATNDYTNRT